MNIINKNIFTQHSEMREHLQTRHQEMTNDIVEFIEESTNVLGNQFNSQNEWLDEILCQIYKQAGATSCSGDGKSVVGMTIEWPEDHASVSDQLKRLHASLQDVQTSLSTTNDVSNNGMVTSVLSSSTIHTMLDSLEKKMDSVNVLNTKMGAFEEKIEAKMNVFEEKMKKEIMVVTKGLEKKLESKIDVLKNDIEDMKDMMSMMMEVLVKKE